MLQRNVTSALWFKVTLMPILAVKAVIGYAAIAMPRTIECETIAINALHRRGTLRTNNGNIGIVKQQIVRSKIALHATIATNADCKKTR